MFKKMGEVLSMSVFVYNLIADVILFLLIAALLLCVCNFLNG